MQGKIAIEEHFTTPDLAELKMQRHRGWPSEARWHQAVERLSEVDEVRLAEMDRAGVELTILSLTTYGIEDELDVPRAIARASKVNDALATAVGRHPDRFAAFAAVPMQDPLAAADEAERAVRELGFKGVLVNGYTNAGSPDAAYYYDDEIFWPFWERLQTLDVPFYLHPRLQLPSQRAIYEGRPELLGAPWSFALETATHALRLITSGLFDRFPDLTVILGHLGELVPFAIHRLEHRMAIESAVDLEKPVTRYLEDNFYVTTSGNLHTPSLLGVLLQMSADRVLFATDYPFEEMGPAAEWLDDLPISRRDREKIGRDNARRLFKI